MGGYHEGTGEKVVTNLQSKLIAYLRIHRAKHDFEYAQYQKEENHEKTESRNRRMQRHRK